MPANLLLGHILNPKTPDKGRAVLEDFLNRLVLERRSCASMFTEGAFVVYGSNGQWNCFTGTSQIMHLLTTLPEYFSAEVSYFIQTVTDCYAEVRLLSSVKARPSRMMLHFAVEGERMSFLRIFAETEIDRNCPSSR